MTDIQNTDDMRASLIAICDADAAEQAADAIDRASEAARCRALGYANPRLGIDVSANGSNGVTGYGWMRARGD